MDDNNRRSPTIESVEELRRQTRREIEQVKRQMSSIDARQAAIEAALDAIARRRQ